MDQKKISNRGLDIRKQKCIVDAIKKEDKLRLKWFTKNEEKLMESVKRKPLDPNTEAERAALRDNRRKFFEGAEKFPVVKLDDHEPPLYDPAAIHNIMRPVDPDTKKLFYTGANKDGRINYLNERVKLLPEKRYYFPETSSFLYGWNMWDCSKTMIGTRFGKSAIIKQSFYRRRGAERDPDWYKAPARLSPTVCSNW